MLHGFTGRPSNLGPLKTALEAQGNICHVPQLPGHGGTPEDLANVKMEDWLDCARAYEFDVIIGLSMGGLLATVLAAERPVSKLILLSPAFYLQTRGRFGTFLAKLGLWRLMPTAKKKGGSDIVDPTERAKSQALPVVPLKALIEFDRLRLRALKALPGVTCPVYSFFGRQDHTVDVQKASALFKNPVIFERSAHVLPVDYDQKELITQCLRILEK